LSNSVVVTLFVIVIFVAKYSCLILKDTAQDSLAWYHLSRAGRILGLWEK